jgi:endopolyphosphatase
VLDKLYETWSDLLPSKDTKEGWNIYRDFVKGGYHMRILIPDKLAVISLNTIYWFEDNQQLDDCQASWEKSKSANDLHLAWLFGKLAELKKLGMSVYLIGHVPPVTVDNQLNYKPRCFQHYLKIVGDFSSIIIGQFVNTISTNYSLDTRIKMS